MISSALRNEKAGFVQRKGRICMMKSSALRNEKPGFVQWKGRLLFIQTPVSMIFTPNLLLSQHPCPAETPPGPADNGPRFRGRWGPLLPKLGPGFYGDGPHLCRRRDPVSWKAGPGSVRDGPLKKREERPFLPIKD